MPLEPEFVADCPYGPDALFLDEILEVDVEAGLIRARWPTSEDMPLTRSQRAHPVRHPRHVAGALMVHVTGMVGFAHAYYVLGLRHRDGWVGYGAKINSARFHALAPPGEPIVVMCRTTQVRRMGKQVYARYELRFEQAGKLVYEGDQTAFWMKTGDGAA